MDHGLLCDPSQPRRRHARKVATENGLSLKKSGKTNRASYTITEEGREIFSATRVDDVDYFLRLHTGRW
jgi:hypothetical protein